MLWLAALFALAIAQGSTVLNPAFTIAFIDRVANKAAVTATLSFTTLGPGTIESWGFMTLNYPAGFFVSDPHPTICFTAPSGISASAFLTEDPDPHCYFVIETDIAAATAVTITLAGLTMCAATAGSVTGARIATSGDTEFLPGIDSGVIGGQVTSTSFSMAASDRMATKTSAAATWSFTTTAGGALATGAFITLAYPHCFFESSGTLGVQISVTESSPAGSVATPNSTRIVITIQTHSIAASTAVTVTVDRQNKIMFAAGELTASGAFVAANSMTMSTNGNAQIAAAAIEVMVVAAVQSVGMAMGATDKFTTRVTTAVTTFSSNHNQTQHQSLLQAWQDQSSPPRLKKQGLLICSAAFDLKPSTTFMPSPHVIQNRLKLNFGSPLCFDNTPKMPPTHCGDDVWTTFAKGKIESIAMDLIAHSGDEDLWTGARIVVPKIPHVSCLANVHYGSRCVADHALSM